MSEYTINPYGVTDEVPAGVSVYNGLDSNSTYMALSAYQGKRLKEMIDAKADGDLAITRFAVNLCDSSKMTSGTLGSSGDIASGSGIVTDFIPIIVGAGTNNWEKNQFVHVCASVFKTNAFGYRAAKVCTYNASKTYIGTISSVSAVIDKESSANTSLFANAEYIRVQFASGTTDHYVALSNRPVLPQYSPYDKDSLSATAEAVSPKFHNTDGAISNMIDTALDYVNNHTALGLGYGDSATAYDETVEPVTCDPWNQGAYTGTKKQINCSTFVQLCLEGVRYANSRYALGSSAKNHGIGGYIFDDKVETNYHNAREGDSSWSQYSFTRFIPCSTHNKLYANKLLKYAHDRGFAFLVEDGLKNLEVGDVLFSSNSSKTFKDVGHTLFVSSVSLKNDGTKIISIMEDGTSGVHETTNITTRDNRWVYAARFPLPHTRSKASNIVTNIAKEASFSTLASGTTKKIGTLTLSENMKAHGVYTAIVKCSAVGDFEVMVGTYSGSTFTALSTNGETLFRRGDGVTVKHIHLPVNSSVNTNSLAVAIKTYAALSSNVEIVEAKVYNGYVAG
jgi:hypothetical protein